MHLNKQIYAIVCHICKQEELILEFLQQISLYNLVYKFVIIINIYNNYCFALYMKYIKEYFGEYMECYKYLCYFIK